MIQICGKNVTDPISFVIYPQINIITIINAVILYLGALQHCRKWEKKIIDVENITLII